MSIKQAREYIHEEQTIISDATYMAELLNLVQDDEIVSIAIDVETSGDREGDQFNPWAGYLVGVGFSVLLARSGSISSLIRPAHIVRSYYLPMVVEDGLYKGKTWTNDDLAKIIKGARTPVMWVMHNAKFDIEWLETRTGYRWNENYIRDPMIEIWLANKPGVKDFKLKELTSFFFPEDPEPVKFTKLIGVGKKKKKLEQVDVREVAKYCMADTFNTLRLAECTAELLTSDAASLRIYRNIELPMLRLLADMEMRGVQLDHEALDTLALEIHEKIDIAYNQLMSFADINWNSTQQVATVLKDKAKLTLPEVYTATGKQQMTAEVLKQLLGKHPIVEVLLDYRGLKKISDTYIKAFYARSDDNFRIHCQYRQTGTRTGRLSCGEPNLQNIPAEVKEGTPAGVAYAYKKLRELFIGTPLLIVADLSQIEFRFAAHYSKDPVLVKAYMSGHDFHKATADAVTGGNRRLAKNINFGYLYGQRAKGLVNLTGMPMAQAKKFYAQFERSFRGLAVWDMSAKAKARHNGYAETILGRKRWLPNIKSNDWAKRSEAERQAVNTIIQGSAADYLKVAMLRIQERIKSFDAYIVMQIHDEIVIDTDRELSGTELLRVMEIVKDEMEHAIKLLIPVVAEPMVVKNWGEAK